jgi:hypothetical protein
MAEADYEKFDDPGLKAAICRAWGRERAPVRLRQRLIASGSASSGAQAAPHIGMQRHFRRPVMGLAAAAMLLIALGISLRFWHNPNDTRTTSASVLPASLADELVARHDGCCAAKDHHLPGVSTDNFILIGQQLRQKLGFPILAARLPGSWNFHGASVCPVGSTSSGHLLFENAKKQGGTEFVSIFSLPHAFVDDHCPSGECAQIDDKHPMAAFVTPAGFYCVVGSSTDGSLSLGQVRALRDQLRPDVAQAESNQNSRVTLAASH